MAKKKEMVSPEQEVLTKSEALFVKYKKQILGIVVALVVVIVGIFAYSNYFSGPREDKASTALAKGQELMMAEQYDKALPEFQKVISDYSGTKAANLANLYVGLCYAHQEKWQDAVKYLEDFDTKDDAMISPAAEAALGDAYANTDNVDKAIDCFKKAAKMADSESEDGANLSLSPTFLMKAGVLLESQGKTDEALTLYKEVKEKYVASAQVQRGDIDKYIQRLEEK